MEQSALREVFSWAKATRIVDYPPILNNPFARKALLLRIDPVLSPLNGTDFASIWITGLRAATQIASTQATDTSANGCATMCCGLNRPGFAGGSFS